MHRDGTEVPDGSVQARRPTKTSSRHKISAGVLYFGGSPQGHYTGRSPETENGSGVQRMDNTMTRDSDHASKDFELSLPALETRFT